MSQSSIESIHSKLQSLGIRNPNYLLLLAVLNCALLMNFHLLIWENQIITTTLFICVGFICINYQFWWATILSIIISFYYFLLKFPRLANHANLEFFIEIIILTLLFCKIVNPKFKVAPNTMSAIFRFSVVLIYFYTGFHKLNTAYFNPCVSCVNGINEYIFQNFTGIQINLPDTFSYLLQYFSVFLELVLPFGLLWNTSRKITAILLLLFHFYLNLAVYSDFSALGAFLILGCIIDFESKTIPKNIIKAFRYYALFTLLAVLSNYIVIKFKINITNRGFIHGFVFNIGWFIFFYTFFKNYKSKILKFNKKPILILSICFILISFWTLRTYIGLGNTGNLTMFSNLVTEKTRNNHFIIDTKKTKIFDFEEDNVLILKLHDTLKNTKLENALLPLIEFKYKSNLWCKRYNMKLNCILVYKNDTIVVPDLKNSPFVQTQWWYRYISFRKIQPSGPNECMW